MAIDPRQSGSHPRDLHPQQTLLGRLASVLARRPRVRLTRLYGVGAPRTGTHSVAAIFARPVRSRHEPRLREAMRRVVAHQRGGLSLAELRGFVRRRDARLQLDVDASHVNAFLLEAIQAEFPDARFLLTIRDCYSWMDSAMNHSVNTGSWSRIDREYIEFYLASGSVEYSEFDSFLRTYDLLSIDSYLSAWVRHNEAVLRSVPAARLLVLKTSEISDSLERIAEFAGLSAELIAPGFRAQGLARSKHGLLDRVDPGYLEERVQQLCGALMRRYFPDVHSRRDALG
ncbi:MAG: sulfotransferase [Planctomycetota bacterium]